MYTMSYKNPFIGVSPGSIDYSPHYPTPSVTIILEDTELVDRNEWAMERFWRVWYKERSTYAPALDNLIIGLRPQTTSSEGIQRFIDYFYSDIINRYPKMGLEIYILPDASDGLRRRRMIGKEPRLVYAYNSKSQNKFPLSCPQSP